MAEPKGRLRASLRSWRTVNASLLGIGSVPITSRTRPQTQSLATRRHRQHISRPLPSLGTGCRSAPESVSSGESDDAGFASAPEGPARGARPRERCARAPLAPPTTAPVPGGTARRLARRSRHIAEWSLPEDIFAPVLDGTTRGIGVAVARVIECLAAATGRARGRAIHHHRRLAFSPSRCENKSSGPRPRTDRKRLTLGRDEKPHHPRGDPAARHSPGRSKDAGYGDSHGPRRCLWRRRSRDGRSLATTRTMRTTT